MLADAIGEHRSTTDINKTGKKDIYRTTKGDLINGR